MCVCIALNWDLDFLLKHVTHIHSCTLVSSPSITRIVILKRNLKECREYSTHQSLRHVIFEKEVSDEKPKAREPKEREYQLLEREREREREREVLSQYLVQ